MNKFCLALLMMGAWNKAGSALDQEQQRGRVLKRCAHGVMPWARQAEVRTLRHRHFEPSERSSTTMTWDSDYRTG